MNIPADKYLTFTAVAFHCVHMSSTIWPTSQTILPYQDLFKFCVGSSVFSEVGIFIGRCCVSHILSRYSVWRKNCTRPLCFCQCFDCQLKVADGFQCESSANPFLRIWLSSLPTAEIMPTALVGWRDIIILITGIACYTCAWLFRVAFVCVRRICEL
jgi:hypothetical protein